MTQFFKYSTEAGNVPNLIPGQAAVNEADEFLWVRANGFKIPVDLVKLQTYAAPSTNGQDGAPLMKTDTGSEWVPSLAPSSVVKGVVTVDQPQPNNTFTIPGVMLTGATGSVSIPGGTAISEEFYVASDYITIDKISFKLISSTAGVVRLAIADDFDTVLYAATITSPIDTVVNSANILLTVPRGHYRVIFWSPTVKQLQLLQGYSIDQGWNLDGSGGTLFRDRQTAVANFVSGIDLTGITWTDSNSIDPGVRRLIAFHWSIPAPS